MRSLLNLYYPGICLERLRKTTKHVSHNSRSPDRDLNPEPPEYEVGKLTTQPQRSVHGHMRIQVQILNFHNPY
jgi:hypothetical protein